VGRSYILAKRHGEVEKKFTTEKNDQEKKKLLSYPAKFILSAQP